MLFLEFVARRGFVVAGVVPAESDGAFVVEWAGLGGSDGIIIVHVVEWRGESWGDFSIMAGGFRWKWRTVVAVAVPAKSIVTF